MECEEAASQTTSPIGYDHMMSDQTITDNLGNVSQATS